MDQPQITPGSNGYLAPMAVPNYGPNPWQGMIPGDSQAATAGLQQGQQNLQSMGQGMTSYANTSGGAYPTFPNSAGLGSQDGGNSSVQAAQAPAAAPSAPAPDFSTALSDASSRGGNPWSFKGEAMSR